MSWSLFATPLHLAAADGTAWMETAHGLPADPHRPHPLPRVMDVLAACRAARVTGTPWFAVEAVRVDDWLPPGDELGEVGVQDAGGTGRLTAGSEVDAVSFRKPQPAAVLSVVCELAVAAGPLLVLDTSLESLIVIRPGDRPADVAEHWPW